MEDEPRSLLCSDSPPPPAGGGGGGGGREAPDVDKCSSSPCSILLSSLPSVTPEGPSDADAQFTPQPTGPTETISTSEFTHQAIMCMIEAVRRRCELYGSRERTRLFLGVQKDLEEQGHFLPADKIRRKWNNLIVTYKRVKDRSRETGQTKTSWEYYEMMDEILGKTLGSQSSGPAAATLVDLAAVAKATAAAELASSGKLPVMSKPCLFPSSLISSQMSPLPSTAEVLNISSNEPRVKPSVGLRSSPLRSRPKLRLPSVGAASTFLAQQNGQAEKRMALLRNFLNAQEERGRLEEERQAQAEARDRRREKRENRVADALGRMATALELVSSKQDTIIALLQRIADHHQGAHL